jgi:hypothetical protein
MSDDEICGQRPRCTFKLGQGGLHYDPLLFSSCSQSCALLCKKTPLVRLSRVIVGIAVAVTVLSVAAVCTLQGIVWLRTGNFSFVQVVEVLDLAVIQTDRTYITSSIHEANIRNTFEDFIQRCLELPALFPLLFALIFLVIFYMWLAPEDERALGDSSPSRLTRER